MSSFTFETGNTRALRRLPLYLLGMFAGLFVPRTDRLWVFGSGIGLGEGALVLYERARDRLGDDIRLVWLATTSAEYAQAQVRGFDTVPKLGRTGLWLTLRARVLVVTHGLGDVNRYGVRGGFVVQVWHGIPLKKLHLDSPVATRVTAPGAGPGRRLLAPVIRSLAAVVLVRGYRAAGRQIALFPVASERVADRIATAFGLDRDRILVSGDPRDDVLLRGSATERRLTARAALEKAVGPLTGRVILYAPTWRDGAPDPALPDAAGWELIGDWLQRNGALLVVRSHPLGKGDYQDGATRSARVRLLEADVLNDVTPILPAVDALVTDYSSIAFDFALVGGPTVFLAPDVEQYVRERGLYEPYATFSGGAAATSWPDALERLGAVVSGTPGAAAAHAHARFLREEYFDHLDGRATERVLAAVLRRTGAPVQLPAPVGVRSRPQLRAMHLTGDRLELEIDGLPPGRVRLDGPRASVDGTVDGSTVTFSLLATRWGRPGLALPSGDYRLVLGEDPDTEAEGSSRIDVGPGDLIHQDRPLFRAALVRAGGGLALRVGPPLAAGETRPVPHRNGREVYLRGRVRAENAVYFESFYGRSGADNPAAIDGELARRHPDVRRYWSVADGSVPIPDGAIRLIEGSAEWWRVRAEARLYVINDWLRWGFVHRPHQKVLQTWHGTMLKRLALDRPGTTARTRSATRRQSRRWHALLAQNPYSAGIFRSAYAMRGPIWETGYPRNDILFRPAEVARVRTALGLPDGARAVLYAPTWRDDRTDLVDDLDLVRFAEQLPDGYVLLVRGHSRTLGHGADLRGSRLLDVTSYPDAGELMLVADMLVTDYSSVMFDFAATGKPMIFFTPDLAHYRGVLRGFYFDLVADAPGPVVTTGDELLAAIADATASAPDRRSSRPVPVGRYAAKYAAWQARFTPLDDGQASERVVDLIYAKRWLG